MPWALGVIVMLASVSAPIQWYAAFKLTNALATVTPWRKRRIRIATLIVFFYPVLYPLTGLGTYMTGRGAVYQKSSLALDAFLTYPFWIGVVFAVQLSLLLLAIDLTRLVLFPFYKRRKERWLFIQSALTLGLAFIVAVYSVARVRSDTLGVRTSQTAFQSPGLPAELDGFKIMQISDVHVDNRTNGSKLAAYVDTANRYDPDLTVFCGDLVSSGTGYIEQAALALGKLKARYGVYACLGDHDYFSDPEMVTAALQKNGITVLRNRSESVQVGSARICLTGTTNVYRQRLPAETLDALAAARPRGALDIFVTHQPSTWLVPAVASKGYDLFLAGHTHGGQIAFPLPGFLLTGSSFETDYVTGFYRQGSMLVSIDNGLGMTLAPIRYQAPAEVTLIVVDPGR